MVHEWSLAEAVLEAVKKVAIDSGISKINRLIIGLGELQNIDIELFKESIEILKGEYSSEIQIDEIEFDDEEAVFKCRRCGEVWRLRDVELGEDEREAIHFIPELLHAFVKCPRCNSVDYEILSGRGVVIKRIEGVK